VRERESPGSIELLLLIFIFDSSMNQLNAMEIVKQNPSEYFKNLKMLHIAVIIGQILFAVAIVFMFTRGVILNNPPTLLKIIDYAIIAATIFCLPASFIFYKWKLNKLKAGTDLKVKMDGYRSAFIMRYALFEIPSIASIVAVMLTGNYQYLVCTGMIILLMLFLRPTKENAIKDLGLNYNEQTILDDPDAIISEFKKTED
jgi:hypothetical protein